jgi:hypothetical protein
VIKTTTTSYPMKLLQSKVLPTRGEWKSFVHRRDGKIAAMAVVWVDREGRYFISTASGVVEGSKYHRTRWLQLVDGAQRVTLEINQPCVAGLYYNSCAIFDRHNAAAKTSECSNVTTAHRIGRFASTIASLELT